MYQKVWKKRKKYIYFTYGIQSLKSDYDKMNSDMAFALINGRTYYLHKKPLLGLIKFGLDWNYFDINFAKYPNIDSSDGYSEDYDDEGDIDLGIMQLEAGMGIGPSITINPVDQLKACVYFHVTPSYSLMVQNNNAYHHYATFFNLGLTVSYKIISFYLCKPALYALPVTSKTFTNLQHGGILHENLQRRRTQAL